MKQKRHSTVCNFTLQQRKTDNENPGRREIVKKIAPVIGDLTNGKCQRVSNPPTKGIILGKDPCKAKRCHSEVTSPNTTKPLGGVREVE